LPVDRLVPNPTAIEGLAADSRIPGADSLSVKQPIGSGERYDSIGSLVSTLILAAGRHLKRTYHHNDACL